MKAPVPVYWMIARSL